MPRIFEHSSSSESPGIVCNSCRCKMGPVIEVHIVTILEECGTEVAIPSLSNPESTCYVVISREKTERLGNDIHAHNTDARSSKKMPEHLQEPEEEVTTRFKETCANIGTLETRAGWVRLTPSKASIFTIRTIPKYDKKWIVVHVDRTLICTTHLCTYSVS